MWENMKMFFLLLQVEKDITYRVWKWSRSGWLWRGSYSIGGKDTPQYRKYGVKKK